MRILIVEDNARLAGLMAALLTDHGHGVDTVETVTAARAALSPGGYDLVLLDLSLPDGDGHAVLETLREGDSGVYVLIVTARGDVDNRVRALNAGADDYIVKPFSDEELVARIRAVARRSRQMREAVLAAGNVRLDTASLTLTIADHIAPITPRELTVLSALLEQQGKVMPREKLERAVYSVDSDVTGNAVEAVVSRLRRRLGAAGATVDITAMRGIGYILTERAPC